MAATPQFIKFPKTPHLEGSHTVDDDAIVSMQQLGAALKSKDARQIVVQEKVDGANVSVHFEEEWNPIIQKRSDIIATGEKEQYNVFRDWVYNRLEALFEVLNTRYCLFGEWLWALHSISYDQLPDFFLAFDIFDKQENQFLSSTVVQNMLEGVVGLVPTLHTADIAAVSDIKSFQNNLTSMLSRTSRFNPKMQHEGVYIRVESDSHVLFRFKLRRNTFVAGRTDFNTHVKNNSLAPEKSQ